MQFISDVAADLFQAKTPDAKDPPVAEDLGVEELVQRCDAIVGRLQGAGASAGPQRRSGRPGQSRGRTNFEPRAHKNCTENTVFGPTAMPRAPL